MFVKREAAYELRRPSALEFRRVLLPSPVARLDRSSQGRRRSCGSGHRSARLHRALAARLCASPECSPGHLHPPGHPHHAAPQLYGCPGCCPPVHGLVVMLRSAGGAVQLLTGGVVRTEIHVRCSHLHALQPPQSTRNHVHLWLRLRQPMFGLPALSSACKTLASRVDQAAFQPSLSQSLCSARVLYYRRGDSTHTPALRRRI